MILRLVACSDNAESVSGSAKSEALTVSLESREKPFRERCKTNDLRFHEEFRGNPNSSLPIRANSQFCDGTLIALQRPGVKTMYGDPFVSLVVAVLFAIVFYNHSSIPNGQGYDIQNLRDLRVRK